MVKKLYWLFEFVQNGEVPLTLFRTEAKNGKYRYTEAVDTAQIKVWQLVWTSFHTPVGQMGEDRWWIRRYEAGDGGTLSARTKYRSPSLRCIN